MLKKEKYDINNFYIGELYLSFHIGSLFEDSDIRKQNEENNKIFDMYKTEAINFQKYSIRRYDYDSMKKYESFLTIFYKIGDKYMCLHNGTLYEVNGVNFCNNLISLSELLPKLSYNIPKEISINDAISMFDLLFKKKNGIKLNNSKYDINDFYVGDLVLHDGYLPNGDSHSKYQYDSLLHKYMLFNSEARMFSMVGKKDASSNLHDFSYFKSLFLRSSNGIYSPYSNQFYNTGVLDKVHMADNGIYEDYYEWMEPFKYLLKENQISCPQSISIPKALKLYKKIDK